MEEGGEREDEEKTNWRRGIGRRKEGRTIRRKTDQGGKREDEERTNWRRGIGRRKERRARIAKD